MVEINIVFLEEAREYLGSLEIKVREKVISNIHRIAKGEKNIELFKKLEGSTYIWEFKTKYCGIAYRLFAFWDTEKETIIVATHGIKKKTQKTPKKEIDKANNIRDKYFNLKRQLK